MNAPGFDVLAHVGWDELSSETIIKKFKGRARQWCGDNLKDVRSTLRRQLLEKQSSRCAYCRRVIYAELGKHEIDHIAPCSMYPEFTYTRINLVATCKRCNWHKREHDPLSMLNKARRTLYPVAVSSWNWVHPYIHSYDQHIRIIDGMIFTPRSGISGASLARARNLIAHCGLASVKSVVDLSMVESAGTDRDDWTAALRIVGQYPEASALRIARLLKRQRGLTSTIEAIRDAIVELRRPHGQLDALHKRALVK